MKLEVELDKTKGATLSISVLEVHENKGKTQTLFLNVVSEAISCYLIVLYTRHNLPTVKICFFQGPLYRFCSMYVPSCPKLEYIQKFILEFWLFSEHLHKCMLSKIQNSNFSLLWLVYRNINLYKGPSDKHRQSIKTKRIICCQPCCYIL